ncbi:MAG: acylphosphatase [Roseiflexus sp.]|nr:acylphosphatase [Roseiflexus sp.]MCS7289296.1 acylphosphatase [Roseiflexus sp.]MDW8145020.1 acylphosphatase [Roseiflexaceae bacterium]MDW8231874.1 acylphosphatase [Roseiflexaceae bacterium]
MTDIVRAHVFISGRVQGVNFRASARAYAREVGVSGWVRNLEDGRVEAVFEGPRSAVQKMVSWCYSGPAHARVDAVDVHWEKPTGEEHGFSIIW